MNPSVKWIAITVLAAASQVPAQAAEWVRLGVDVNLIAVEAAPSDGRTVLLARDNQPSLRSTDGGRTWAPFEVAGAHPLEFLAAPTDGKVFYAITGDTGLTLTPPPR